ncbi:MAG: hypothetical protein P4L66_01240 [Acetobacteraceae bacterium]|nr:hypothetical protein [Acetobacteraceae bacterium]
MKFGFHNKNDIEILHFETIPDNPPLTGCWKRFAEGRRAILRREGKGEDTMCVHRGKP